MRIILAKMLLRQTAESQNQHSHWKCVTTNAEMIILQCLSFHMNVANDNKDLSANYHQIYKRFCVMIDVKA